MTHAKWAFFLIKRDSKDMTGKYREKWKRMSNWSSLHMLIYLTQLHTV